MRKYFLLTAFGKDRPGIVSGVTQVLFEQRGNLEDTTMTRLGGEFCMMVVVSFLAPATAEKIAKRAARQIEGSRRSPGLQKAPALDGMGLELE